MRIVGMARSHAARSLEEKQLRTISIGRRQGRTNAQLASLFNVTRLVISKVLARSKTHRGVPKKKNLGKPILEKLDRFFGQLCSRARL